MTAQQSKTRWPLIDRPNHGGDMKTLSQALPAVPQDSIDLSTGINPDPYPIPAIPSQYFYQLPSQLNEDLVSAASAYYGVDTFLVGAGSQAFIELLPRLRSYCRVAVPDVGYREHAWHWQRNGHELHWYCGDNPATLTDKIEAGEVDCAVVINPNNPSCTQVTIEQLHCWQQQLASRQGWLIIDEAFIDMHVLSNEEPVSFTTFCELPGVIILRSLGKFFGLAGLRIGFLFANRSLLETLSEEMALWGVTAASQHIAGIALSDRYWQGNATAIIQRNNEWLYSQLKHCFKNHDIRRSSLFISVVMKQTDAVQIHSKLASKGVIVRLWPSPTIDRALLRFGLISAENGDARQRLTIALNAISSRC